ncbi:MAG: hypothetical protein NXI28_19565, partial [bacterium]|nr:hypothetical protein [bacterium]
ALACLGGVPFAGGAFGGVAGAWSEREQSRLNKLFAAWLKLQEAELKEIGITLVEVMARLDGDDPVVQERIESAEYLSLVRKCFRDWSAAESEEKRVYVRNLLANAAACRITSDDVIRLFIKWINDYSEAHFAVIKDVYGNSGSSRGETWRRIHGADVREDSAEADLFKLLYRDLSTGGIMRQHRPTDGQGNFLKQSTRGQRRNASRHLKSAFDDDKPYELTELGKQFVHYTMNEIVPKIAEPMPDEVPNRPR